MNTTLRLALLLALVGALLTLSTGCVYVRKDGETFTYFSTKNVSVTVENSDGVVVRIDTSGLKDVTDAAGKLAPLLLVP